MCARSAGRATWRIDVDDQVGWSKPVATIALVEPDADVREFIQALLSGAGYHCETFVSAELTSLLSGTPVQLLITDSDLPGTAVNWRRVRPSTGYRSCC
jgi:CheY-like chemotaxis protein